MLFNSNKTKAMDASLLDEFAKNIFKFITGSDKTPKGQLVKKHSDNIQNNGDFSFPNSVKSWIEHLHVTVEDQNVTLLIYIEKHQNSLVEESKKWIVPISKAREINDRIHVFLDRPAAVRAGLLEASHMSSIISRRLQNTHPEVHIDPLCENQNNLTSLRLKILSKSIQNLSAVAFDVKSCHNIFLTSKSSSQCPDGYIYGLCGTVLNAKTVAKETSITDKDYIKLRQDEMSMIAQHKYGVRVTTDCKWKDFIAHLGESAVIFELLQIKPSSAIKINFDNSSGGSSKGASFVLYNCARLETIIRTYQEKVDDGTYPPLPTFEDTDFALLTQEEEWVLIFNYIMGFPSILRKSVEINNNSYEFRPHYICSFLSAMVRVFSQYYRKVRILTEPRKHLLPVIFARMHMLTMLNETLKSCLRILDIKSVTQM